MCPKGARSTNSQPVLGLLPWQSYLLVFVLGLLAVKYPGPAVVAMVVFYLADWTFRGGAFRLSVLACVLCAAFGFAYASQRIPELPEHIPAWVEEYHPVMVDGVVDSAKPRFGNRLHVILRDVQCNVDGRVELLPGKVAWSWRHPKYHPESGQAVRVWLRLVPVRGFGNPGGWDYGWYWQRQGVFWRAWIARKDQPRWGEPPSGILWTAKSGLHKAVAEQVPDSQGGAMVLALVTGDRSRLDEETIASVRAAGLAHTLALSGLHVGFVAAIGLALAYVAGWICPPLFLYVPRPKLAVLLAAPLVLGYAWLGQPSASLIRAAIMYFFWGFLLLQGRGRVLMDGLFFALAVIVFVSPLSVFDLSLQMSVVAVAGIGLMFPRFQFMFGSGVNWWRRLLGWIGGLLIVSLCANIALLPLVSWYFGTMSPDILLNVIWLPTLGFVAMPLGILGMLLGIMPWSAGFGGVLIVWSSSVMDWLLALLQLTDSSGLTPVLQVLRPLWPEMVGCALLLVTAVVALGKRSRIPLGLAGAGFALMVLPHVSMMISDARDEIRLTMIDVGLGQALVVSLPGGRRWLVDGGGGSSHFDIGEAVVAPYLTYGRPPRLDGAFMSHPDSDHSHGLPFVLSRFDVGSFFTNGMLPRGRTGKAMSKALEHSGITPVALAAGDSMELAAGTVLEVLHPADDFTDSRANEHSLVLRLVRGDHPLALMPGDVEKDGIAAILKRSSDLKADILVLPHHGSKASHVPELYNAVTPEAALCSNGHYNRYDFPDRDVVKDVGAPTFTTSRYGQVVAVWNSHGELSVRSLLP